MGLGHLEAEIISIFSQIHQVMTQNNVSSGTLLFHQHENETHAKMKTFASTERRECSYSLLSSICYNIALMTGSRSADVLVRFSCLTHHFASKNPKKKTD